MSSSELSDALNPYASQTRQRAPIAEYSPSNHNLSFQPVVQPPQQYVPHVSELEMAIAEPPAPAPPSRARQGAHIVAELFRIVAATQNSQEIERKRRLAWEQDQEAKATQRQAKMEKKMQDMFNEITSLRSTVNILTSNPAVSPSPTTNPLVYISPSTVQQLNPYFQPASPISPVAQHSTYRPTFVQGSSNSPLPSAFPNPNQVSQVVRSSISRPMQPPPQPRPEESPRPGVEIPHQAITPDPSPQLTSLETSTSSSPSGSGPKRKNRRNPIQPNDDGSSSSSSSDSTTSRPRKRLNHHDTRCYTIQHAMRSHVCRMMNIESDRRLPDSHIEGNSLDPFEPVRFVWDKTTKQSVHNARMKTRVLEDIMEKRRMYKHVPQKEFNRKSVEAAFEQRYVTLRQKFRAQRDALAAENTKKREDIKARKARHLSRRKLKLNNRAEARLNLQLFEHVTFDGAFQLECMSSEESDFEIDPVTSQPSAILRTHGYAWRSTRLLRFFSVLDEEEKGDTSTRPKRGVGRKERRVGSPREEFSQPPQGISTWMISRRWYKASLNRYPDLPETVNKLIVDPLGFNWTHFHDLGEESADETVQELQPPTFNPHVHSMSGAPLPQDTLQQHHYNQATYMNYTL